MSSTCVLVLCIASLGVIGAPDLATADQAANVGDRPLSGTYTTAGVNRDKTTYSGTLTIEQDESHRLYMQWRDDDASYDGHGALIGRSLYVVWGSADAQCFVVFFDVTDEGALDGFSFSAVDRDLARGRQHAAPLGEARAGELFASYASEGVAPDGSKLSRDLQVTHMQGDFYRFRWGGDPVLEGVGQLDGKSIQIIASFSGHDGQCGKSEIERDENGVLHGTWTMNDDQYGVVGTETAVPVN